MLLTWAAFHQDERLKNWVLTEKNQELFPIDSLRWGDNEQVVLQPQLLLHRCRNRPGRGLPGDLSIVFLGRHWQRIDFRSSWMGRAGSKSRFGVVWTAGLADKQVSE